MKKISTTKLAQSLDYSGRELFDKLASEKLIFRKDDQWNLTHSGKEYGGEVIFNPKYGEFIVWPSDFNPFKIEKEKKEELINATKIGDDLGISNRRINQVFLELGWSEKSAKGWRTSKQGAKLGGVTFNHDSGATYILWPKSILKNNSLLNSIGSHDPFDLPEDYSFDPVVKEDQLAADRKKNISTDKEAEIADDYRKKYEAKYRTKDGHYVRSRGEVIIDDALYDYGLTHAYERRLPVENDVLSDFYIRSQNGGKNVYIEYWGMTDDEKYLKRKEVKKKIYLENGFNLIELFDKHIERLDDHLPKMLLKFDINVE